MKTVGLLLAGLSRSRVAWSLSLPLPGSVPTFQLSTSHSRHIPPSLHRSPSLSSTPLDLTLHDAGTRGSDVFCLSFFVNFLHFWSAVLALLRHLDFHICCKMPSSRRQKILHLHAAKIRPRKNEKERHSSTSSYALFTNRGITLHNTAFHNCLVLYLQRRQTPKRSRWLEDCWAVDPAERTIAVPFGPG